jgi:hypothetical protein
MIALFILMLEINLLICRFFKCKKSAQSSLGEECFIEWNNDDGSGSGFDYGIKTG